MAELGRREEVVDPLSLNPREKGPDRSLPTYGIRNPQQSAGNAVTKQNMGVLNVLDGIRATVGRAFEQMGEEAMTNGQLAHMQGKAEASIPADDRQGRRGWQSMETRSKAQDWFTQEADFIANGKGMEMTPDEYRHRQMETRSEALKDLPKDPAIRKMYVASFDDFGPRLAAMQVEKYNEYNVNRGKAELTNNLMNGGTNSDAGVPSGERGLNISQEVVRAPYRRTIDASERDVAIRTMLGEAGGEGAVGQAAVAQVLINRTQSGKFPNSIKEVALQPKQFSTWNEGEGGNNPQKFDPNSTAYQRAGAIFDAAASGRIVDMTGGAINYVATKAKGGVAWWDEAAAKGKEVEIGGHTFIAHDGSAQGGSVVRHDPGTGQLMFLNKGQEGIRDDFRTVLENTSAAMGVQLKITSGHRTAEHNAAVGGAKQSEHVNGDASDIDMSGMNDQERYDLVQTLRANGARRFSTYDKSPNMLHVDMSDKNGAVWFMHDKSNSNMGRAPDWFQQAMTSEAPQPGQVRQAKVTGSQTQRWLQASPLKGLDKADALTTAIVRSMDAGDDTIFTDSGGIATIIGMGGTKEMLDKVYAAQKRFDEKKDKEFDLDAERARADILGQVSNGDFATEADMWNAVDEWGKRFKVPGEQSRQLARSVATEWNKGRNGDDLVPLPLRSFAAKMHEAVVTGEKTEEEAGQAIIDFSKKAKIKDSVVNNFVADMFQTAESERAKLRTDAETAYKKQEKEKATVNAATSALTQGFGLKGMEGRVTIPDDRPGNAGKNREVSAEEYGIWALKKSTKDDLSGAVSRGELTPDQAQTQAFNTVYENLSKQQVYDTEFGSQIAGSVKGDIIDHDTKKVSEEAMEALSFYMQMENNPKVGGSYLSGMIQDKEARDLLGTASKFYNGQMKLDQALLAARKVLDEKLDPNQKIEKTGEYTRLAGEAITTSVAKIAQQDHWWSSIVHPWVQKEVQAATETADDMKRYISEQASIYKLRNTNLPTEVAVKQASEDLQRNAVVVGGKVIIGNEQMGTRLDQAMGLTSLGRTAPDDAIRDYLEDFGATQWGVEWTNRHGVGINLLAMPEDEEGPIYQKQPAFDVYYNRTTNLIDITLYKDKSKSEPIGNPMSVDAKELGERYKKKQAVGESTFFTKSWRDYVVDPIADKQIERDKQYNVGKAGAAIGSMIKKQ